ncbi:hypothetical protein BDV59DRAFT_205208 [Aspergillus ambiguus]|uniref:uncharacterized protein n=1 Tax=Aspergillus ambiguus TaxID=176160 RepID=UPI003CCC95DD
MKFSLVSLLPFATLSMSLQYTSGYESLKLGRLQESEYKALNYSEDWSVGRPEVQVSNAKWNSKRVLFSGPREVGKSFGYMTRTNKSDKFSAQSVYVACSIKSDNGDNKNGRGKGKKDSKGEPDNKNKRNKKTVPCSILINASTRNELGIEPTPKIVHYNQLGRLQEVNTEDFEDINKITFTVTKAGTDEEVTGNVTLVVDDFKYAFDD